MGHGAWGMEQRSREQGGNLILYFCLLPPVQTRVNRLSTLDSCFLLPTSYLLSPVSSFPLRPLRPLRFV